MADDKLLPYICRTHMIDVVNNIMNVMNESKVYSHVKYIDDKDDMKTEWYICNALCEMKQELNWIELLVSCGSREECSTLMKCCSVLKCFIIYLNMHVKWEKNKWGDSL